MYEAKKLDGIITKTIEVVGESREQIFAISEESRRDYQLLSEELKEVRLKVASIIEQTDRTELHAKFARKRLAEVSSNFDKYTIEEVKAAYEQANEFQVRLAIFAQEEKQLRQRRDQLERRLLHLKYAIDRAETLSSQMSVVYNFLAGDLKHFGEMIVTAKEQQAFGLQIIEAQEEERKRLSREIHDGPAQMLANVMLRAELVERVYEDKGIEQALEEIRNLRKMVVSSLSEVRRIIYDLRPMALDDLGIIPALSNYLKNFSGRTGLDVQFKHLGKDMRFSQQIEVSIFRLVQEAVQNAYKHAKAASVQVKVEVKDTKVILIVKDDGIGFDPTQKKENSFGLIGMKERVHVLEGKIDIVSKLNSGTTIIIDVPIH
ncbi:MAG TPA: histidine kinase [Bacilli bacterium]|nr:histidine kinase [Bacilli bacterium]